MNTTLKRDRLIEAAKILFYQQGVTGTTLADIAQQALFAQLDRQPAPRQRLLGLLAAECEGEQGLARYGCPYGSLSQELNKEDGQPATTAVLLFQACLDWAATQFRLLGKGEEEAKDLAMDLIASLQGTFVLANSFRSPELLERKLQRLELWLCSL